jgi:thioesterase domain-containing protein
MNVEMRVEPPTLFLLPGAMGYGPSMSDLANALRTVAKVVPIKYPDLKTMLGGNDTVAYMADLAVEQIQRSQPAGEVRLLGHSLGGAVGYEVAVRLLNTGRAVKFLGILDTSIIPNERRDYWETLTRVIGRIRTNRANVTRLACRALAKVACALGYEAQLTRIIDYYSRKTFNATCFRIKLELQQVLRSRACARWKAGRRVALPISATLFRCDRAGVPQSLGWDGCFANLDVIAVSGNHIDLVVEPHLTKNRPLIERAIQQTCVYKWEASQ